MPEPPYIPDGVKPPGFVYPHGIPVASSKDAGMLAKMVGRGLKSKPKGRAGKKGIASRSTIHIGKRKQIFY